MLDTVKRTISDYMMLETSENVLVALSGGADSTALCFCDTVPFCKNGNSICNLSTKNEWGLAYLCIVK